MPNQSIHFQQAVRATVESVRGAFTRERDLRLWLCDGVCFPRRIEGPFLLWWRDGTSVTGRFLPTDSENEVRLTWQEDGACPAEIHVSLQEGQEGTTIDLTIQHAETLPEQDPARIRAAWEARLLNLASIWSMTGIDLRIAKQPALGLLPGEPVPLSESDQGFGVPILSVIEGSSAERANLLDGDILLEISGVPITAHTSFPKALTGREAGDTLTITYVRNRRTHVQEMTLLARPPLRMPPVPPGDFAEEIESFYTDFESRIRSALATLPDSMSTTAPEPAAWSANEILAHLILFERLTHEYIAHCRLGYTETHMPQVVSVPGRIEAVMRTVPTREALLDSLHQSLDETVALLRALPSEFVSHPGYIAMGQAINLDQFHYDRHVEQLERTVQQLTTSTPLKRDDNT